MKRRNCFKKASRLLLVKRALSIPTLSQRSNTASSCLLGGRPPPPPPLQLMLLSVICSGSSLIEIRTQISSPTRCRRLICSMIQFSSISRVWSNSRLVFDIRIVIMSLTPLKTVTQNAIDPFLQTKGLTLGQILSIAYTGVNYRGYCPAQHPGRNGHESSSTMDKYTYEPEPPSATVHHRYRNHHLDPLRQEPRSTASNDRSRMVAPSQLQLCVPYHSVSMTVPVWYTRFDAETFVIPFAGAEFQAT